MHTNMVVANSLLQVIFSNPYLIMFPLLWHRGLILQDRIVANVSWLKISYSPRAQSPGNDLLLLVEF